MFNEKEIGSLIAKERKYMKLSLEELASKINVSRQTLSKWEKGEGEGPTIFDLIRLCKIFNCDYGYLVGEYSCKKKETFDIQQLTGLSEKACGCLATLTDHPCAFSFIDDILSASPEQIDKIAKKQIAYSHVKNALSPVIKQHKNQIDGKSVIMDVQINGESLPKVPIQDIETYALFDLWLAFSDFMNAII